MDFWLASNDSWLIPMTVSPLVSASATHSIAQTWVTMTTPPGRAARSSSLSCSALTRICARRAAWRRRSGAFSRPLIPRSRRADGGCVS